MSKKLGIPYQGSKRQLSNKIVDKILELYPKTEYVYDVFGGGGSISFEFLQRPQIKKVFYNEKNKGVANLLKKIKKDGITDEFYQWVDKDTFHKHKNDNDCFGGLIKCIWSFGNNQMTYLFGKNIENYKKLFHELVVNNKNNTKQMSKICIDYVFEKYNIKQDLKLKMPKSNSFTERRLDIRRQIGEYCKKCKLKQLEQLQQLEQLERLQQLERLERLVPFKKLSITSADYKKVKFKTDKNKTIIYLDPPYTSKKWDDNVYQEKIDRSGYYEWIDSLDYPVFESSYESKLEEIAKFNHRSTMSPINNSLRTKEKLFIKR